MLNFSVKKKRDYSLTSWPEFSVIIHWQNKPFRTHTLKTSQSRSSRAHPSSCLKCWTQLAGVDHHRHRWPWCVNVRRPLLERESSRILIPPPLCWSSDWWREQSLYCRSVCPDNPRTGDDRDWTVSHNLCHYQHHQTRRASDGQVSCEHPLQWTIATEPAHNPTHRASPRGMPWSPTLLPASSAALYLENGSTQWTALPSRQWASSANTQEHPETYDVTYRYAHAHAPENKPYTSSCTFLYIGLFRLRRGGTGRTISSVSRVSYDSCHTLVISSMKAKPTTLAPCHPLHVRVPQQSRTAACEYRISPLQYVHCLHFHHSLASLTTRPWLISPSQRGPCPVQVTPHNEVPDW